LKRDESLVEESVPSLKKHIESLEQVIHLQVREIHRLKEMNKHLLMSNQSKLDLLYEERKL
jgi:hypothetical protein